MRHRTKPLVTALVAILGGLFCCLAGCSAARIASPPTASLEPNYLASIAPAHWPLAPASEGRTHITYKLYGGNSIQRQLAEQGADLWNNITRRYGVEVGRVDAGELIPIEFVGRDQLGAGNLGITEIEVNPAGEIVRARVRLTDELLLPPTRRQALAGHEVAHALGVRGHSDSPFDLMNATVPLLEWITPRDANTMAAIYRYARDGTPYPSVGRGRQQDNGNRLLTFTMRGAARDGPLECREE